MCSLQYDTFLSKYGKLLKICSIQYDISIKISKIVASVSALANIWDASFACLLTNSTLELT